MLHSTDPTTLYVPGIGRRSNGLYLYFHTDWLGSTRYTSRSGGVATEQMRYDGWGQRIWLNHLDPANPANPFNPFHPTDFQWGGAWGLQTETAYPNEPGLGLHYIQQRYYDPLLGRFISQDPLGYLGGENLFLYAENDPVNLVDPTGLQAGAERDIEQTEFIRRHGWKGLFNSDIMASVNDVHEAMGLERFRSGDRALGNDLITIYFATMGPGLRGGGGAIRPWRGAAARGARGPGIILRSRLWLHRLTGRGVGFNSRPELYRAIGNAGRGRAWHHIVEQHQGNIQRFGVQQIQNTANIVSLRHGSGSLHQNISNFYSSLQPQITGSPTLTIREWLRTQSFQQQRTFGLRAIRNVARGIWRAP